MLTGAGSPVVLMWMRRVFVFNHQQQSRLSVLLNIRRAMYRAHAKVCPSIKRVTFQEQDVASGCLGCMGLIHFGDTDVSV